MNTDRWQWLKRLPAALAAPEREPAEHAQLILTLQRSIVLPARALTVAIVLYHFYNSPWLNTAVTDYAVVVETIQRLFVSCAMFMMVAAVLFYVVRRFPTGSVQWLVFTVGLMDGVFLAGLTVITGGFKSDFYWVYPVLILINAVSIPLATPQIVLNLLLGVFFLGAGLIETNAQRELSMPPFYRSVALRNQAHRLRPADLVAPGEVIAWIRQAPPPVSIVISNGLSPVSRAALASNLPPAINLEKLQDTLAADLNRFFFPVTNRPIVTLPSEDATETSADPYVLRVTVLILLTFCCYGVQVLSARQRRLEEERQEFLVRTGQLRAAGRLAAEVAHQIKNPLAIINNVSYSLQKSLKTQRPESAAQIEIIQEEIAKADRIITQIMGYAQLSEGRVEKLEVLQEIARAIDEVFPAGLATNIKIHRAFDDYFPPVMMHNRHLAEAVGNLLQNARDALVNGGNVYISARCRADYAVEITVRDDGPGIPPDKLEKVFEAYYTTKPRGTGLGLALVKHNVELYGGTVRVESALGRGATFILEFPAKSLMKPGP